jgi:DNA polymerase V
MNILSSYIPFIEIYSIDEAFLDLQDFKIDDIYSLCKTIQNKILKCTGIPVSIGIARTKTLAKIANRIAKKVESHKDFYILQENDEDNILNDFPIENIWGIGRKLSVFLNSRDIRTAKKFRNSSLKWARLSININAEKIIKELRGEKCFLIQDSSTTKKSICTSRTFGKMVTNFDDLSSSIAMYATRCAEKLRLQNSYAHFAYVYIQTNPFRNDTKQYFKSKLIKFDVATNDTSEILNYVLKSIKDMYKKGYQYKKAGVVVSGIIQNHEVQENLFDDINRFKKEKIIKTVDEINQKMGQDVLRYLAVGYFKKWQLKQQKLSPCYTTRWSDILKINLK